MFNKCVEAQISSDIARSKVYANECAEIKKIAKIVLTSQLALERVIVRLQTVEEFGEILMQIVPVMDVVSETKGQIAGIIPEVSSELEDVNIMLHDMSLETGEANSYDPSIGPISEDAAKVLRESSLVAEEMMKEKFPEPKVNSSNVVVLQEGAEPQGLENLLIKYIENADQSQLLKNYLDQNYTIRGLLATYEECEFSPVFNNITAVIVDKVDAINTLKEIRKNRLQEI